MLFECEQAFKIRASFKNDLLLVSLSTIYRRERAMAMLSDILEYCKIQFSAKNDPVVYE